MSHLRVLARCSKLILFLTVILPMMESSISAKSLGHHVAVLKMNLFEPSFCQKLESGLQEGSTLLLCVDAECFHQNEQPLTGGELAFITKVLQRDFAQDPDTHTCTIETPRGLITIHPEFQLYLISNKRLEDIPLQGLAVPGCEISDFCVVDGALSFEGMERHLQRFIITREKPEYKIRYKSLLTDLTLHQQQLMDSQVWMGLLYDWDCS